MPDKFNKDDPHGSPIKNLGNSKEWLALPRAEQKIIIEYLAQEIEYRSLDADVIENRDYALAAKKCREGAERYIHLKMGNDPDIEGYKSKLNDREYERRFKTILGAAEQKATLETLAACQMDPALKS